MTTSPQKKKKEKSTWYIMQQNNPPVCCSIFQRKQIADIFRVVHLENNYSGNDFFPVMRGDEGTEAGDM